MILNKPVWFSLIVGFVATVCIFVFLKSSDSGTVSSQTKAEQPANHMALAKPPSLQDTQTIRETSSSGIEKEVELEEQVYPDSEEASFSEEFPKSLQVNFPNGESITVNYDLLDMLRLPRISRNNAGDYVQILLDMADKERNGEAAFQAAELLEICSDSQSKKPSFQFQNHTAAALETIKDLCENVTDELLSRKDELRQQALESGAFSALDREAFEVIDESNPKEKLTVLERAWDLGYVSVGWSIAAEYYQGLPPHLEGTPDMTTGYAYQLAQNRIYEALLASSNSVNAPQQITSMNQALLNWGSSLSPQEQQRAEQMAAALIRDNKNCCKDIWPGYQ